jgi:hypothetical protein
MGWEMSSEFIVCENEQCPKNADLIIVYGCLEQQHVSDVLLCMAHYAEWTKYLPSTICGTCGHFIDRETVASIGTKAITMKGARNVLLRPRQQAQMKKRTRGLSGAWGTPMNTLPMRSTFPISNVSIMPNVKWVESDIKQLKKDMDAFTKDTQKTREQIDKLTKELEKNSPWERTARNIFGLKGSKKKK